MKSFDRLIVASLGYLAIALLVPWLAACELNNKYSTPVTTPSTDSTKSDSNMASDKETAFRKHCEDVKGQLSVDSLSHSICIVPPDNKTERM